MNFQLPAGSGQVTKSNELPPEYSIHRIPGAITLQGSSDTCRILTQEVPHQLCKISYHVLQFFKKGSLEYSSEQEGLHTHAALESNTLHTFPGIGRINVLEGQYAAFCGHSIKGRTRFDENAHYRIFDVSYSPELVSQVLNAFPKCAEAVNSGKSMLLSRNPQSLNIAMRTYIQNMLKCKYVDATRALYLDGQVRDYLFATLQDIYEAPQKNYRFSPSDTEKILEAKRLLLQDLSRPRYTINELVLAVGLNSFKLKGGFRYYFQSGIAEMLREARMEKARELLLDTNKSTKEIGMLTGYPTTTSFMKAFRKFFGHSTGELRRKRFKV